MTDKLIVNVALTGCVHSKATHPSLPITPQEVAEDAARCRDLGATIFHLHARDHLGNPTWHWGDWSMLNDTVRDAVPDGIFCVSCSGRHWNTFTSRANALGLPGVVMGSLVMGSMNFPTGASVSEPSMIRALAKEMERLGVIPELECFELGHVAYANHLIGEGVLKPPHWFNLLLGNLGTAPASFQILETMASMLPEGALWAGGGIGRYQWQVNQWAISLGGHVRVGLEDSLWMGKGVKATNPSQVERVVAFARTLGIEPATPSEARGMVKYR